MDNDSRQADNNAKEKVLKPSGHVFMFISLSISQGAIFL
jgi:hypothetical protein